MASELQVREHLRNDALFRPIYEPPLSNEWKRRLFLKRRLLQQLQAALEESPSFFKKCLWLAISVICIAFALADYLGWIQPARWSEALVSGIIGEIPSVGLNEVILFIAMANGLTLLIRKRSFLFG